MCLTAPVELQSRLCKTCLCRIVGRKTWKVAFKIWRLKNTSQIRVFGNLSCDLFTRLAFNFRKIFVENGGLGLGGRACITRQQASRVAARCARQHVSVCCTGLLTQNPLETRAERAGKQRRVCDGQHFVVLVRGGSVLFFSLCT